MNYKGMNMDMTCQGFQYEQGKEYEHDGPVKCCPSQSDLDSGAGGFHACEYPLDVFGYYAPAGSRFFEVEQGGEMEKATDNTKVASKKIKIGAELGIAGMVKAAINYTMERTDKTEGNHATGDKGAASATGDFGAASATGTACVALASGVDGVAMGTKGNAICVVERGKWDGTTYPIVAIKAAVVDGVKIKENVYYTVKNGEWVEV